jgi:hypothetical protein
VYGKLCPILGRGAKVGNRGVPHATNLHEPKLSEASHGATHILKLSASRYALGKSCGSKGGVDPTSLLVARSFLFEQAKDGSLDSAKPSTHLMPLSVGHHRPDHYGQHLASATR